MGWQEFLDAQAGGRLHARQGLKEVGKARMGEICGDGPIRPVQQFEFPLIATRYVPSCAALHRGLRKHLAGKGLGGSK